MQFKLFQVDAFTRGPFTGNPAAICPLDKWIPDHLMQNIAMENNLSETAFFVPEGKHYRLRWFTPQVEVDLCGHATLASAFVLFTELQYPNEEIRFSTRSGILKVTRTGDEYIMDFPSDPPKKIDIELALAEALGAMPEAMYKGKSDWMCVFAHQSEIENLNPDFYALSRFPGRGILVTAPADEGFDFVSRGFFPQSGINEDPATGSAHTTLTPYWCQVLKKKIITACQLSGRKGFFHCEDRGARIIIKGKARLYLKGEIFI